MNLLPALFRADTVNFRAVTGTDDHDLFDAVEIMQFFYACVIVQTGDRNFLANFQRCSVMTDSGDKQWHG